MTQNCVYFDGYLWCHYVVHYLYPDTHCYLLLLDRTCSFNCGDDWKILPFVVRLDGQIRCQHKEDATNDQPEKPFKPPEAPVKHILNSVSGRSFSKLMPSCRNDLPGTCPFWLSPSSSVDVCHCDLLMVTSRLTRFRHSPVTCIDCRL